MIVGLVATNGGAHPPEKLAGMSVQRFLDDFLQNAPAAAYQHVQNFRDQLDKILTAHHKLVQEAERSALQSEGPQRLTTPIDTDAYVEDAVDDVMGLALRRPIAGQDSEWSSLLDYFRRRETRQYFENVMHSEFHHSMWNERSWHAQGHHIGVGGVAEFDAHPEHAKHPAAKAFLATLQHGHALLMRTDEELEEHGGREMVSAIVTSSIPAQPHSNAPDAAPSPEETV